MSVARIVIFQSLISEIIFLSNIAIEYASSPLLHPALQILKYLTSFLESIISGSICSSSISKFFLLRKKYVSPTVRWLDRISMCVLVSFADMSQLTNSNGFLYPNSFEADLIPLLRSLHLDSGKCSPIMDVINSLNWERIVSEIWLVIFYSLHQSVLFPPQGIKTYQ